MGKRAQLLTYLVTSLATVAAVSTQAQAQAPTQESADEIVVTGSYIKRSEGFPSASPVDVLSAQELAIRAPTNLSNFFQDIPANFGSTFSTGRALGGGERGLGTVNLRGLGNSATLVLLNGHRQTQVADSSTNVIDVNSLVPDIMVERFEVLKDGASALYGSDAVAGVVNVITRDRFSGLRLQTQASNFDYRDRGDRNIQVMAGSDVGGKGHIVAAVGYFVQDLMPSSFDSPTLNEDRTNFRFTVDNYNPGTYRTPNRNNTGGFLAGAAGTSTIVDPTCGVIPGTTPTTTATRPSTVPPTAAASAATALGCVGSFFDDNALQSGMKRYQAFARGTYDITDNIKFTGEFGYTDFKTETTYTAGETIATNITVPGHNPGAPKRAVNQSGQALFAVSSGVSAGYSRDGSEVFLPTRNAAGVVTLTGNNGLDPGIPFYEDTVIPAAGSRLLGSQCGLPTQGTLPLGDCALTRMSKSDNTVTSAAGYLEGEIGANWNWKSGISYSKYAIATNGTPGMALTSELNRALDGQGGPACAVPNVAVAAAARNSSVCQYFNPFGSAIYASPGSARANTQSIINWVFPLLTDRYESKLVVVDAQVAGTLVELPAGPLGLATGLQYRRSDLIGDYDINRNAGNTTNLNSANDFNAQVETKAAFAEVNVPIVKNGFGYIEANAAVRYEEIGEETTTNPKVGVLYNTSNDMLTLRASYGTSFVAPSLFQLYGNIGAGAAATDCAPALNPACTGTTNLRITSITTGNPNLKPSSSDAYNFGATLRPLDGLTLSLDRWNYTFEDLIATEAVNAVIAADPTGANGKVVRNSLTGALALVRVQFINAPKLETSGYDFGVNYKKDFGGIGRIDLDLSGTRRDKYEVQQVAGAAIVDGLGQTNGGGGRAPLVANPKWRSNFRATWAMGPHSVNAILHYYGNLTMSETPTVTIDTWAPVDLSYAFNFTRDDSMLKGTSFSVGVNNVADQTAPFVPYPGFQAFLPTLYDIRGRSVYVRLSADF